MSSSSHHKLKQLVSRIYEAGQTVTFFFDSGSESACLEKNYIFYYEKPLDMDSFDSFLEALRPRPNYGKYLFGLLWAFAIFTDVEHLELFRHGFEVLFFCVTICLRSLL